MPEVLNGHSQPLVVSVRGLPLDAACDKRNGGDQVTRMLRTEAATSQHVLGWPSLCVGGSDSAEAEQS